MGHLRLGILPTSKKWQEVVSLIPEPSSTTAQIAAATINAAKGGLRRAANDNGFIEAFWLLTQIPLAARQQDFRAALENLGLQVPENPGAFDVLAAMSDAVERAVSSQRARSDFAELSLAAAQETLSELCIAETRSLFGATPEDVRESFRKYSTSTQFRRLARVFFKGFTARYLKSFLSRELSNHVGDAGKFAGVNEHSEFNHALDEHCFETAKIIEEFAGGWFSKTNFERGIITDGDAFCSAIERREEAAVRLIIGATHDKI
jgi:hypothetical protein